MSLKNGLKKQTPLWCWLAVAAMAILVLPGAVAKPALDEPKPPEEKKQPMEVPTIGDSADAIRLNEDFVVTADVKPNAIIAYVNDRPVRLEDVIPSGLVVNSPEHSKFVSPQQLPMIIQSMLRQRLPYFLYDELVMQHFAATVPKQQQAIIYESLKPPFEKILKQVKSNNGFEFDEQLSKRFAREYLSIDRLEQYYFRMQIVSDYAQKLPIDSPLRAKEEIIEECRSMIDDWDLLSEPANGGAATKVVDSQPTFEGNVFGVNADLAKRLSKNEQDDIKEGLRYTVKEIHYEGNTSISTTELTKGSELKAGDKFNSFLVSEDIDRIRGLYREMNLESVEVDAVPGFSDTPGELVLVFQIDNEHDSATHGVIAEKVGDSASGNQLAKDLDVYINGQEISRRVIDLYADRVVILTQTGEGDALESGNQAAMSADVDYVIDEPSGVGLAIAVPANIDAPKEVRKSANPTVKLAWEVRESVRRRSLSADHQTPWQIMNGIEGLRRDLVIKNDGVKVNALEWIQAGPVYKGESWFEKTQHGGRAHPYSAPFCFEGHINQFLAKLAACRVPLDATFGTPDGPVTIRDMISHAKMTANDKEEVSWTLLALCRYLPSDAKWINAKGEEWNIERLVQVEIGKAVGGPSSPNGGTDGLYALAVARNEYLRSGKPLEGVWLKADEKIQKYIDVAKSQQHSDGTLSSDFFRSSKRKETFDKRLASTGHILQFLMHAVSDEQLKEDGIRRAVEATANDMLVHKKEFVSCDPLYTTTAALTTYLERVTGWSPGIVAEAGKPVEEFHLRTYNVADLVTPFGPFVGKPDLSPVVELIKTTIEPDSWSDGRGKIVSVQETLSLAIRQTTKNHEQIAKLLSQLRKDQTQIQISCQLLRITTDEQMNGLKERCNLLSVQGQDESSTSKTRHHWALLNSVRSEQIGKLLTEQKAERVSARKICMISDRGYFVDVGSPDDGTFRGFRLNVRPHLVQGGSVIRLSHSLTIGEAPKRPHLVPGASVISLSHSVTIGEAPKETGATSTESLMSSGQTLLLLLEIPQESALSKEPPELSMKRFVILLTAETMEEEEEMIEPAPPENSTPDDSLRSGGGR